MQYFRKKFTFLFAKLAKICRVCYNKGEKGGESMKRTTNLWQLLQGCLPNPTDAPTVRVGIADMALLDLYQTLLPIGMLPCRLIS